MVRVPTKIALIRCLHVPLSLVLSVVWCGVGKRLNILASENDSFLVRMRLLSRFVLLLSRFLSREIRKSTFSLLFRIMEKGCSLLYQC